MVKMEGTNSQKLKVCSPIISLDVSGDLDSVDIRCSETQKFLVEEIVYLLRKAQ